MAQGLKELFYLIVVPDLPVFGGHVGAHLLCGGDVIKEEEGKGVDQVLGSIL